MPVDTIVHVIDDDDAARDSLAFLLGTAGFKTAVYESAAKFLKAAPSLKQGCIVTDVRMPEMDGITLLRHLKQGGVSLPVIVMTGHGDIPLAVEAMKIGAIDFIEKPYDDEHILNSVRRAINSSNQMIGQQNEVAETNLRIASLTVREQQVLQGLIDGKPNKIIAFDLNISPRTVEIYRANVMTKMNANSLSDLVRMTLLANSHPE